jgi:deoxyribodipyrimidine photo-lyase
MNPWIQQKKIDPQCEYIKKWLIELQYLSSISIHNLYKQRPINLTEQQYLFPIVDHLQAIKVVEDMFSSTNGNAIQ